MFLISMKCIVHVKNGIKKSNEGNRKKQRLDTRFINQHLYMGQNTHD